MKTIKFKLADSIKGKKSILMFDTGDEPKYIIEYQPYYFIHDIGSLDQADKLLEFIDKVITSNESKDEYWTNGYTLKVIKKEEMQMFKIYFRLTDDYPPVFISPADLKLLIELWIKGQKEFLSDPQLYKEKLERAKGGIELPHPVEILTDKDF